jgi:hypothetical protein
VSIRPRNRWDLLARTGVVPIAISALFFNGRHDPAGLALAIMGFAMPGTSSIV